MKRIAWALVVSGVLIVGVMPPGEAWAGGQVRIGVGVAPAWGAWGYWGRPYWRPYWGWPGLYYGGIVVGAPSLGYYGSPAY